MRTNTGLNRRFRIWMSVGYGTFSLLVCVLGVAYSPMVPIPAVLPYGIDYAAKAIPLVLFGAAWFISGVLGVWAALTQLRRGIFELAVSVQIIMHLLWGVLYTVGLFEDGGRTYLNPRTYLAFTLMLAMLLASITALRPQPIVRDGAG